MKKRFLQMVKKRVHSLRLFPLLVCLGFLIPAVGWGQAGTPEGVWTDFAATDFAGGDGTESDPYQIATAEQLAKLSKDVGEGTSYQGNYFILTADIDLSAYRWVPIGIYKWMSNGTSIEKSFRGYLDGSNKTISGMVVDERDDQNSAGFFGCIRNGQAGNIVGAKDLTISGATVYLNEDGLMECSGGILGGDIIGNENSMVVFENIRVSGFVEVNSINGFNKIGGMLGYASWVKAINCHAENVSISGASNSGGFVGNDNGSVFENCTASGTVSGRWGLGGFVGYTTGTVLNEAVGVSTYTKCAADVDVSGNDWRLGGFVGYAEYGEFNNCVAYGNVDSSVDGWEPKVGGFMGECGSAIAKNCHAAGTVTSASPVYKAGGFVGTYSGGTLTDCSFDKEKNPTLNAAGEGDLQGDGVTGEDSSTILANICEDYYGGHQYSTEWTVDTEATCTTKGSKYQACERCGAKGNITEIPALGHQWGEPVYTWSEDNTACTAKRVCLHDSEHSQTATATVTSEQTQAPTCTDMGEMTYTATFIEEWAEEQTKTEGIPAKGHNYVNGTCTICGADDPDYVEPEPEPEPEPTYYRVDLRPVEGATVILSADEVEEGGTLTFTIEIAEGYVADDLMVTVSQGIGKAVEVKPDEAGVYTVKEVDGLVTITVYGVTEEPATAIGRVEGLQVYAHEGAVCVHTPTEARVVVVSMGGSVVASGRQTGLRRYALPRGFYVVWVDGESFKVAN